MTASLRRSRRASLLVFLALAPGCSSLSGRTPEPAPPTPAEELPLVLLQAGKDVMAGRYQVADKLLHDFTVRYPTAPEGGYAIYARALYKLDPANQVGTAREALALLDSYLAIGTLDARQRAEGAALRRTAATLIERAAAAAAAAAGPATQAASPSSDRGRDEELARVRDELAKANAELERIKRRLAKPKP